MLSQPIWTLSLHVGAVMHKPDMLLASVFVHVCLNDNTCKRLLCCRLRRRHDSTHILYTLMRSDCRPED